LKRGHVGLEGAEAPREFGSQCGRSGGGELVEEEELLFEPVLSKHWMVLTMRLVHQLAPVEEALACNHSLNTLCSAVT
jgi:hypothetical protein